MAMSGVFMTNTDGNIVDNTTVSTEKVSGLLFDISKQSNVWLSTIGTKLKAKLDGAVVELNSMTDVETLGIPAYKGVEADDFMYGIPYYHINHFFKLNSGTGRLFVMFADCSANWDAISQMQRVSHGLISQIGVWTDQPLFSKLDASEEANYTINLVGNLDDKGKELAAENAPLSIVLCANSAKVKTADAELTTIDMAKIPNIISNYQYVTVLLGQALDTTVTTIQLKNPNHTPVGSVGAAIGCLAVANVQESLAWVGKFNVATYFPDVEMGFGDVATNEAGTALKSTQKYSSISVPQLNMLDDKGFVFLVKYSGIESGVYFSKDRTCSNGDYRTIGRNRTINKSRRGVRRSLLSFINSPIKVDPTTGYMSPAQITVFNNAIKSVLDQMVKDEEISGYSITISSTQNVLTNDKVLFNYKIVPVGTSSKIDVTEGFSLTNK